MARDTSRQRTLLLLALCIIVAFSTIPLFADTIPEHSVAILNLTPLDPIASSSDFYAVAHCCEAMGIPCDVVTSVDDIDAYPLTLIACMQNSPHLSAEDIGKLHAYVLSGGWLFASDVSDPDLFGLFGISDLESTRTLYSMTFDTAVDEPGFDFIDEPEEITISLGRADYGSIFKVRQYSVSSGVPLAYYENGEVAMMRRIHSDGRAYALGFRLADIIHRGQTNHDFSAQRTYSNGFEPSAGVFMLFVRSLYEERVHIPLLRHTIPRAHKSAMIITHDVDAQHAYDNSSLFAELEKSYGHKSTFFIETKYFQDALDAKLYTSETIAQLQEVKDMGYRLQSHSVGHFPDFHTFPKGEPDVMYPFYQPRYRGEPVNKTTSGTIYGEVKISKLLLDRDFDQETLAFRSGHLCFPPQLPEVLEDCGYLYDSSFSANNVLQAYPYFLVESLYMGGRITNVLEIPLTISDYYLTSDNVIEVLFCWLDVLESYSNNFAPVVLLIHPSRLAEKLAVESLLLNEITGMDLWRGDLSTFGRFYRNRAETKYEWQYDSGTLDVYIRGLLNPYGGPVTSFVFKDKGTVNEINVWYQPYMSEPPEPLDVRLEKKYGYTFIDPELASLPKKINAWVFF